MILKGREDQVHFVLNAWNSKILRWGVHTLAVPGPTTPDWPRPCLFLESIRIYNTLRQGFVGLGKEFFMLRGFRKGSNTIPFVLRSHLLQCGKWKEG